MADLNLSYINQTHVRLDCESWLFRELDEKFTFYVPGYKFMPKYKAGIWDGKIRMLDQRTLTTYVGLIPEIYQYCKASDYTVELDSGCRSSFKSGVTEEEVIEFISKSNLPYTPHDYQIAAVVDALTTQRKIILSATGSGKSLVIYLIQKFLIENNLKGLIIVPTVSLVEQLYTDFENYSSLNKFPVQKAFHRIYSGKDKNQKMPVYISTWQSLQRMPKNYFERFDFVIGDEVHLFEAKTCSGIVEKSTNAVFRLGLTGTIEDAKTSETTLKALFGPIKRYTSTKELMERKVLADLRIKAILLKHQRSDFLQERKGTKYKDEIDYIISSPKRMDFLVKLCSKLPGNTLVLFQYVDKHGKPLYQRLKAEVKDKKIHMVYGGTDADTREKVRAICDSSRDNLVTASYGVFSTGTNIVNIDNIVFASSGKAKIRVLQSIGRGLRRGATKQKCTLLDLVDDLSGATQSQSYSEQHFEKRLDMYAREGFDVEIVSFVI